jgi:hypothetical protein
MFHNRSGSTLTLIALITAFAVADATTTLAQDDRNASEIKRLIDQLASPNRDFKTSLDGRRDVLPFDYDLETQEKVLQTWDKLVEIGPPAFPYLFDHFDDNRYSATVASVATEVWHHCSVGQVCKEIVSSNLQPYGHWSAGPGDPRDYPHPPDFIWKVLKDDQSRATWWKDHQGRPLRALQLDVAKWRLTQEKAEQPDGRRFPNEELKRMQSLIEKLEASDEPLKVSKLGYSHLYRLSKRHVGEDRRIYGIK